jgi:mycothiol synthase
MENQVISGNSLEISSRPMRDDDDFWRVRDLLIQTYPITPTGFNWEVRRWDGWRYYTNDPTWNPAWEKQVHLWEIQDGKLVGAVHLEGSYDTHLQIHPDYRHIEEDMIIWAENNLAVQRNESLKRHVSIFVYEYDSPRRQLLEKHGFDKTNNGCVIRRLRFGHKNFHSSALADHYTIRNTNPDDSDDCRRIAELLNNAFNRDFHTAEEYRVFTNNAPCFRQDLDFVAIAPDGSFAAYAGVPYNKANNYGVFEPVCTHPDHLRKGLARSLMIEALYRLQKIGANDVYVGTGDQKTANLLYDSIGFTEAYKGYEWRKVI